VRLIAAALALEVYRRIARIVRWPLLIISSPKALQASPCFDQCSVHREVLVVDQSLRLRERHHFAQEFPRYVPFQRRISVLGESGALRRLANLVVGGKLPG